MGCIGWLDGPEAVNLLPTGVFGKLQPSVVALIKSLNINVAFRMDRLCPSSVLWDPYGRSISRWLDLNDGCQTISAPSLIDRQTTEVAEGSSVARARSAREVIVVHND